MNTVIKEPHLNYLVQKLESFNFFRSNMTFLFSFIVVIVRYLPKNEHFQYFFVECKSFR